MNEATPQTPPKKKKKGGGCAVALMVLAGIAVIGLLGVGIAVAKLMSTPEGKQIWKAASGTMRLVQEAQNAPGAKEVAKQGGCQQALVMDMDKMAELVENFTPDSGARENIRDMDEKTMVTCQVGFAGTAPTCEQIARIYVDAAHPTAPFRVTVQQQGASKAKCDRSYDEKGEPLE